MGEGGPLVTCIMPVQERRKHFVVSALRRWAKGQAGVRTELILVADPGAQIRLPMEFADRPDIRLVWCTSPILGRKHEYGAREGAGELVAKWDDDDWFGPKRLAHQVEPIMVGTADIVSLVDDYAVYLPDGSFWRAEPRHRHPYHDGTLVYRRSLLEQARFGDCSLLESAMFVEGAVSQGSRHVSLPAGEDFVYTRHQTNTWRFKIEDRFTPAPRPAWFPEDDLQEMTAQMAEDNGNATP